jgi:hypothetical protein
MQSSVARAAVPAPEQDPFYAYQGSTPLAKIAPGTVLKTRTTALHIEGIELPVRAVQLLYRSTSELGKPTVNVTSVLLPPLKLSNSVISYQSFYDSLNTEDDPSYAISGGVHSGGEIAQAESVLISPALLAGETVVIPDTEGEEADFSAGPVYGYNTLDSLRAALSSPATGLTGAAKIGLAGYSGGAIATGWAAQEAPTYAPEINRDIVGASMGGVLVDPAHNLKYVEGSSTWASIIPMSLDGLSRAFHLDLTYYLNEYGQELMKDDEHDSITNETSVPGLTWSDIAKPEYPSPEGIKVFVETANKLIMGHEGRADADRPGQRRRRIRRHLWDQAGNRAGRRRHDRRRRAQPRASVLWPGRRRALHRIPASRPHRGRRAMVGRNCAVADRTLPRPGRSAELLGNRPGQLAGADRLNLGRARQSVRAMSLARIGHLRISRLS